jgi:hypothetical protein
MGYGFNLIQRAEPHLGGGDGHVVTQAQPLEVEDQALGVVVHKLTRFESKFSKP